ncbi:MAG: hypothetical protein MPJ50_16860 [Pirellulales bacterium]|nr:hypothetical protein [Pirellulales bacterium]
MSTVEEYWNATLDAIYGMDTWEWFSVLVLVLVVGLVCMKGFGSRDGF